MATKKNQEHVNAIAYRLDSIANGTMYIDDDGEWHDCQDMEEIPEDWEQASMYDYFEDSVYDYNFILDSDKNYKAGRVLIAFGGPNIWIDTDSETVDLTWWDETAHASLSEASVQSIDDFLNELYSA